MQNLEDAEISTFQDVRFILTDMDETLTYKGKLSATTYTALERLQAGGIRVIVVTAAPAGWCDQMARMWPIDGVIGENGGLFFRRGTKDHAIQRSFWHDDARLALVSKLLEDIGAKAVATLPFARLADDQAFRQTSLAFEQPNTTEQRHAIIDQLQGAGLDHTINNLWILGWLGGYDKLKMAGRVLKDHYGLDIAADRDAVLYVGDSTNDAPMFSYFRHTVGVSTVVRYLDEIETPPTWVTRGPGGEGFVEAADAVLRASIVGSP